jgi:hypothetical protein
VFSLLQKNLRFKPLLDITKNTIAVGLWGGQAAFWILSWHYAINQPFFFPIWKYKNFSKKMSFIHNILISSH